MTRLWPILLGFLLVISNGPEVWAVSKKATALRQANGLVAFNPPETFLAGNFVADEVNPSFIFGTVKDFAASRKCPTTWVIEEGIKNRLASKNSPEASVEYTLYLEEDCPDKVVYYVFVDQSGMTPQQWMEWRRKFHRSKTDPLFGATKTKLEQACKDGCAVSAELRYIQTDGELMPKTPEKVLHQDLKFAPIYDLNQKKKMSK